MIYDTSFTAIAIFGFFVALVLGISFYLGSKAKSAAGYFAAHGQVHWLVNGVAFAGDYLSAASFLGICGMIAFGGYDGFLYSIGFLAGWIVALFVIAEPLKRLGKYTFADALDNKFRSRGIKLAASVSTLVVSIFYLIPQMVGSGALIRPLLGLKPMFGMQPHAIGVVAVGVVVILIVVTAGMVSTTWVQFIKGTLLVVFCLFLTGAILQRGLSDAHDATAEFQPYTVEAIPTPEQLAASDRTLLPSTGKWEKLPYLRIRDNKTNVLSIWRKLDETSMAATQFLHVHDGQRLVNGYPHARRAQPGEATTSTQQTADFYKVGQILKLPTESLKGGDHETGPLSPLGYFATLQQSEIVVWQTEDTIIDEDKSETTIYYPRVRTGADLLTPGASTTFASVRSDDPLKKLDFLSLMLALFCGTASLPHILIRYYTVKDQASARKSTVVGIASIGFFYVLTLYLGLGAMTSGVLDPTNNNMAAPLLALSFGALPFAFVSAIAFTTVLGTVSGLILAASGAVAHDLVVNLTGWQLTDHEKIRVAKLTAVVVGAIAIVLGILFEKMNVGFLVGWAFNIAASANLPALVMLLFWKRTTKQGITAAILVGMTTSLVWVMLSKEAYKFVYNLPAAEALVPFSQPAIITIPLGFLVLIVVSLLTPPPEQELKAAPRKFA